MIRYILLAIFALSSAYTFGATPTITAGISTGNDGYTVHLKGTNFQSDSYIDVRAACGGNIIQSYSGSAVRVVDSSNIYFTITDATQQNLFLSSGEYFWVVNPTPTATWSSCQFAKWVSPPPPQLLTGTTSGSDGYTIHLTGQYFHSDSRVDVRTSAGGSVIASYFGVNVVNDSDITFYISDATQRNYLNTTGLYFWVVNPTPTASWNGPVVVTRVATDISYYDSIPGPTTVTGTQTLLQRSIVLSVPTTLFISSDGNVAPTSTVGVSFSSVIKVDNANVSNLSTVSWAGTTTRDTHSFNNIGTVNLQAGTHVVTLSATASGGSASVGTLTNLSTMLAPATTLVSQISSANAGPINFNTYTQAQVGNNDRSANPVPHPYLQVTSMSVPVVSGQPLVLLASGVHVQSGHDGDSAIGFWLDSAQSNSYNSSWGSESICGCAELTAPFYLQGLYSGLGAGSHQAVLGGTELYWSDQHADNPIIYTISAGARLIAMTGGIRTSGVLYSPTAFPMAASSMLNTIPVTVSAPATLASGNINVPANSNGVVYFSARTRMFGGPTGNATLDLQIMVDGQFVGSIGVQGCGNYPGSNNQDSCVETKTLTASYLAAGATALAVGNHSVQVIASLQSTTPNQLIWASIDAPLIWFD